MCHTLYVFVFFSSLLSNQIQSIFHAKLHYAFDFLSGTLNLQTIKMARKMANNSIYIYCGQSNACKKCDMRTRVVAKKMNQLDFIVSHTLFDWIYCKHTQDHKRISINSLALSFWSFEQVCYCHKDVYTHWTWMHRLKNNKNHRTITVCQIDIVNQFIHYKESNQNCYFFSTLMCDFSLCVFIQTTKQLIGSFSI